MSDCGIDITFTGGKAFIARTSQGFSNKYIKGSMEIIFGILLIKMREIFHQRQWAVV